jgi:Collagen triple helix repeat (20 copies)
MFRSRRLVLLLLSVACGALISSGTASAACLARPLVLVHTAGRTTVKLPAFLRATMICGADRGPRGVKGERGNTGATGARGVDGTNGGTGQTGSAGANGINGAQGAPGRNGIDGLDGARGPAATPDYAYFYNVGSQAIGDEAAVQFNTNGLKTSSIIHPPGTSGVVLSTAGIYKVTMSILATDPFRFALFQNAAVVSGSEFAANGSTRQGVGMTIITAAANDVLSVRNHGLGLTINLDVNGGGTPITVDASILIERLA